MQLKDVQNDNNACAALVVMDKPTRDSSALEIFFRDVGRFCFYAHAPAANRSVELFKKVAQLDPKNQTALQMVATSLVQQKRESEACDLYLVMLKGDPATVIQQDSGNVVQAFMRANRVPELVKFMQDWDPPAFNPMTGGQDSFWAYVNIAQQIANGPRARRRGALPQGAEDGHVPGQDAGFLRPG